MTDSSFNLTAAILLYQPTVTIEIRNLVNCQGKRYLSKVTGLTKHNIMII